MSPDADKKLTNWFESMHFSGYDDAYEFMRSHQHGKVFKSQYEALDHYYNVFVPLPFVELQPSNVLQNIQSGQEPLLQQPFPVLPPSPVLSEPLPEPELEPSTSFIRRVFNSIRGVFQ